MCVERSGGRYLERPHPMASPQTRLGPRTGCASAWHEQLEPNGRGGRTTCEPQSQEAEVAFHGGPHCHINVNSGDFAFPSHMAHLASGPGNVFNATACPE